MRDVISLSEPIIDSLTYDKSDTETDIPSPGTRRASSAFVEMLLTTEILLILETMTKIVICYFATDLSSLGASGSSHAISLSS